MSNLSTERNRAKWYFSKFYFSDSKWCVSCRKINLVSERKSKLFLVSREVKMFGGLLSVRRTIADHYCRNLYMVFDVIYKNQPTYIWISESIGNQLFCHCCYMLQCIGNSWTSVLIMNNKKSSWVFTNDLVYTVYTELDDTDNEC